MISAILICFLFVAIFFIFLLAWYWKYKAEDFEQRYNEKCEQFCTKTLQVTDQGKKILKLELDYINLEREHQVAKRRLEYIKTAFDDSKPDFIRIDHCTFQSQSNEELST